MNLGPSSLPLPKLEGQRMAPTGSHLTICVSEATADRLSGTRAKKYYNLINDFETRREKVVDQDYGYQNGPMGLSHLDSSHIGTNRPNRTTSPIELIQVGKKSPKPTILTLPTDFLQLPTDLTRDLYREPSLSYSLRKYN